MSKSKIFDILPKWTMTTAFAFAVMIGSGCGTKENEADAVSRYDKLPGGAYSVVAEVRAKPGKETTYVRRRCRSWLKSGASITTALLPA